MKRKRLDRYWNGDLEKAGKVPVCGRGMTWLQLKFSVPISLLIL